VIVRAYLPMTLDLLGQQYAAGQLIVPLGTVAAADETEETEYAALMTAADASAELLDGPGRRVVVVVELDAEPAPGQSISLRDVVAVHADLDLRPANADPDDDLAWFATQEIPDLL
jgi:hypothetical protein